MLLFMSDFLEEIIYFVFPVLFFLVFRFAFRVRSNLLVIHYLVVSSIVGILTAIFGPTCLCDDIYEKIHGTIIFASMVAVISLLAFLLVDLFFVRYLGARKRR
jgi:sterol desaturase/sphingolipid hydroxylase (fatty acid hydroxylase superfamily)